ncbi:MAG: hypothetical protein ACREFP_25100 [Acetobacteraceae bacterium]
MSETPDSIYQLLKRYEGQFTPSAPYLMLEVGTLDVDNRAFSGLSTKTETDPEPIPHRSGEVQRNPPGHFEGERWVTSQITRQRRPPHDVWRRTITIQPAPKAALQRLQLVFAVSRPLPQVWSVTANGITVTASASQTSVSVDIWDASTAQWTGQANGISHSDSLLIHRPAGVVGGALGAFTIPVSPVTIIYAPPADSLRASTASYAEGQTVGCTTDFSSSTDQSHTVPTSVIDTATMSSILGVAAGKFAGLAEIDDATGKSKDPAGAAQFTSMMSIAMAVGTGANAGGPGQGDIFDFLHNVEMAC